MPNGYYQFVQAGTIRVFAVIIYDPSLGRCFINTYSVLDRVYATKIFYRGEEDIQNTSFDELSFQLTEERKKSICDFINSSYAVRYDGNGGTIKDDFGNIKKDDNGDPATMLSSLHESGKESKLAKNEYTRFGYEFAGWELRDLDGNTVKVYSDRGAIKDIAKPAESITLYAVWTPVDVTFSLVLNDKVATDGETWKGGTPETSEYKVKFDSDIKFPVPEAGRYYEFLGWFTAKDGGGMIIDKEGNICNTEVDGYRKNNEWTSIDKTLTLYSHWGKVQGKEDFKYISTVEDLETISKNSSDNILLYNDIDFCGKEWKPIDTFSGIFDGDFHTISNLTIKNDAMVGAKYIGFIRENSGTIKTVNFKSMSINSEINYSKRAALGFVTAKNDGRLINCNVMDSTLKGYLTYQVGTKDYAAQYAGGICAFNNGTIMSCDVLGCSIETYTDIGKSDGQTTALSGGIATYSGCCEGSSMFNCYSAGNTITARVRGGKTVTWTKFRAQALTAGMVVNYSRNLLQCQVNNNKLSSSYSITEGGKPDGGGYIKAEEYAVCYTDPKYINQIMSLEN